MIEIEEFAPVERFFANIKLVAEKVNSSGRELLFVEIVEYYRDLATLEELIDAKANQSLPKAHSQHKEQILETKKLLEEMLIKKLGFWEMNYKNTIPTMVEMLERFKLRERGGL